MIFFGGKARPLALGPHLELPMNRAAGPLVDNGKLIKRTIGGDCIERGQPGASRPIRRGLEGGFRLSRGGEKRLARG